MESRIDCINIKKPNCEYYDERRLCPNDCRGFESNKIEDRTIPETIAVPLKGSKK